MRSVLAVFLFCLLAGCQSVDLPTAKTKHALPRVTAINPADIALRYVGWHESKHHRQIRALIGHDPRGRRNAWCSSFTCAVVKKAGHSCPRGYKAARSFLRWGVKVSLKHIRRGDVVIFSRGRGKGHNGFFLRWKNGRMEIVSGNSGNRVRVGLYSTKRLLGVRRAH